jgi:hypothetical protein
VRQLFGVFIFLLKTGHTLAHTLTGFVLGSLEHCFPALSEIMRLACRVLFAALALLPVLGVVVIPAVVLVYVTFLYLGYRIILGIAAVYSLSVLPALSFDRRDLIDDTGSEAVRLSVSVCGLAAPAVALQDMGVFVDFIVLVESP